MRGRSDDRGRCFGLSKQASKQASRKKFALQSSEFDGVMYNYHLSFQCARFVFVAFVSAYVSMYVTIPEFSVSTPLMNATPCNHTQPESVPSPPYEN